MTETIAIRTATDSDRGALERLATLDSAPVPRGELLVAEVGGELVAATEITAGETIADPFRDTADLLELLALRADRLRHTPASRRRPRLRPRWAYRIA